MCAKKNQKIFMEEKLVIYTCKTNIGNLHGGEQSMLVKPMLLGIGILSSVLFFILWSLGGIFALNFTFVFTINWLVP